MTRTTITCRVGADGVLSLRIPFSPADANQEVLITIESPSPRRTMTQDEWRAWVESMAGSLPGDFERPDQGEFEQRDSLY
jgi:hypothetical protein